MLNERRDYEYYSACFVRSRALTELWRAKGNRVVALATPILRRAWV
jgi:hypothetical protein